ncbi:hypothetical protein VB738_14635 [Cyanobium gracile UHCC 0139]|uniref:Uncharacterized protein n=1 Tax=Cyanobium gracile UHCC 0139 TaxID=3110308 RepID=A0ABU5RXJ4_9CYAN|nr:hypothetical protein [Cyanobium gracile]MEA5392497.1 hypothetical protein [Cyanobium gracile UHCC 0139]
MRALSFLFALMVGLAMAFLAPALAGGHGQATAAMAAPEMAVIAPVSTGEADTDSMATDLLPTDVLASDLLAELGIDPTLTLDGAV